MTYTAAERRTLEPVRREAEQQARSHPERRDLFLCHAWGDRLGAAKELHDLLVSLDVTGVADKELSALLATDRVIPVAHGTTFEALRDVRPLLAARSGLSTEGSSLEVVAAKIADTVRV